MIDSDCKGSGAGPPCAAVTVKVALAVTMLLSGFVEIAVMVVEPLFIAIARPDAPMVATAVLLEDQVTLFVKFT